MSRAALGATRATVSRWFVWEAIVIVAVTLLFLPFSGLNFALSVFLGGILCLVPSLCFARRWFSDFSPQHPGRMMKTFYVGEILKLCLTGLLFIVFLKFLTLNLIGCVLGYMLAQVAFWLAPLVKWNR